METKSIGSDQLYTVKEVAGYLRKSIGTVKAWAGTGRIEAVKIGRTWRVKESEIQRLMNGGKLRPPADSEAAEDAADVAFADECRRTSDPSQRKTSAEVRAMLDQLRANGR